MKSKHIGFGFGLSLSVIVGVSTLSFFGCSDNRATLQVYSWSDYFDPELIEKFEEENNCKVSITSFDSNEALYAKLKAGGCGYDLLVPSSYLIPTLVKEGILQKPDHSLLTNVISNFDHKFDGQIADSKLTWSVPYACTYTGLMYVKDKVKDASSWKVIADSSLSKKVSLLDDMRELVGIGLMYNGHSLNSTNRDEIIEAAKTVTEWRRKNVRKFDAESYKNEVSDGSLWLGHGYSSDAAQVIIGEGRDDIGFALPDEGFTVAWDELVIPSDAKNVELAHRFIDFFYDDEVAYQNMLYICSLVPNKTAVSKIPDKYRPIMLPKNLDKGQLLRGFEDAKVMEFYNDAFDIIKAR